MSVPQQTPRAAFPCNGISRTFSVEFSAPDSDHFLLTLFSPDGQDDVVLVLGQDYTVSMGLTITSFTLTTAPEAGFTLLVERRTPIVQSWTSVKNGPLDPATIADALDHLARVAQELQDYANRAVKVRAEVAPIGSSPDYSLPAPETGKVLSGNADASGWENADPATLSGVPISIPLAINYGGTSATTASAARQNLGIGDAATRDVGTGVGQIPVLDSNGLLPSSTLPSVSATAAGVLPAHGTGSNSIYIANTGWTQQFGNAALLADTSLSANADSISAAAPGSAWAIYQLFLVEALIVMAAADGGAGFVFQIDGTWREVSQYVYHANLLSGTTAVNNTATPAAPANIMNPMNTLVTGPNDANKVFVQYLEISDLSKLVTGYPIVVRGEQSYIQDNNVFTTGRIIGRNSVNFGPFTGIKYVKLNTIQIKSGSRLRVWGIDQGSV